MFWVSLSYGKRALEWRPSLGESQTISDSLGFDSVFFLCFLTGIASAAGKVLIDLSPSHPLPPPHPLHPFHGLVPWGHTTLIIITAAGVTNDGRFMNPHFARLAKIFESYVLIMISRNGWDAKCEKATRVAALWKIVTRRVFETNVSEREIMPTAENGNKSSDIKLVIKLKSLNEARELLLSIPGIGPCENHVLSVSLTHITRTHFPA